MHVEIPEAMIAENDCYPLEPTDEGGGVLAADGYHNLFAWLNSFTR